MPKLDAQNETRLALLKSSKDNLESNIDNLLNNKTIITFITGTNQSDIEELIKKIIKFFWYPDQEEKEQEEHFNLNELNNILKKICPDF